MAVVSKKTHILSFETAEVIREKYSSGCRTQASLAEEYEVSQATISAVIRMKAYHPDKRPMTKEQYLEHRRRKRFRLIYGISYDIWMIMLERAGYSCEAGCGTTENLVCDHDHETGKVRGVLCNSCNLSLGQAGDSPARLRALADYLERKF